MYLMCPSGLLEVLYSAIAEEKYLSKYWSEKDRAKVLKYQWGDTTYLCICKKDGFKRFVNLKMMTPGKLFDFEVTAVEKSVDPQTGLWDMLIIYVVEPTTKEGVSFVLLPYEKDKDIYWMNHLPRSEALNED